MLRGLNNQCRAIPVIQLAGVVPKLKLRRVFAFAVFDRLMSASELALIAITPDYNPTSSVLHYTFKRLKAEKVSDNIWESCRSAGR